MENAKMMRQFLNDAVLASGADVEVLNQIKPNYSGFSILRGNLMFFHHWVRAKSHHNHNAYKQLIKSGAF